MQGIHAINSQIVYVAGGVGTKSLTGFIARTTDGGLTWDSVVPENNYNRHEWISVKSSGSDHIIVYGAKSHYVFSDDAGKSWKNDSVPGTLDTGEHTSVKDFIDFFQHKIFISKFIYMIVYLQDN